MKKLLLVAMTVLSPLAFGGAAAASPLVSIKLSAAGFAEIVITADPDISGGVSGVAPAYRQINTASARAGTQPASNGPHALTSGVTPNVGLAAPSMLAPEPGPTDPATFLAQPVAAVADPIQPSMANPTPASPIPTAGASPMATELPQIPDATTDPGAPPSPDALPTPAPVPEPESAALLGASAALFVMASLRRRSGAVGKATSQTTRTHNVLITNP